MRVTQERGSAGIFPALQHSISTTATYWEKVNVGRWGKYLSDIEYRAICSAAQMAMPPRGNALEVGCEGGRWAQMLEQSGWTMNCTDVNPQALEVCRTRLRRGHCFQVESDGTKLPLGDESVSLVLCVEVFPVIYQDWFMEESWRVMVPGGTLVGVFLNLCSWKGLLHRWRSNVHHRPQWYHRSYIDWRRHAKKTGFRFLSQEGISWMPFARGSDNSAIPFATRLEHMIGLRSLPSISPWIVFIAQKPPIPDEAAQAPFVAEWKRN